ncbi:hypothetical protein N6H05_17135 [Sphingobium sp. WTD-1]|uniref:hypothetical protein n=1 Tax=Sphingobium sp. WTD-1 TaxID=2979467 RepID=UPI0024DEA941|nr:hypothetical protein [Sphingobium sp. WTD-1]WIA54772.1 hypothetical protein N6H05_17135 [Sphingobium sp. WTD-1]
MINQTLARLDIAPSLFKLTQRRTIWGWPPSTRKMGRNEIRVKMLRVLEILRLSC